MARRKSRWKAKLRRIYLYLWKAKNGKDKKGYYKMTEKIWTLAELEEIRKKSTAGCWKKSGICNLGPVEMYEHSGGVFVEGHKEKQWVYFTCSYCNYQWALWKILRRLKEEARI